MRKLFTDNKQLLAPIIGSLIVAIAIIYMGISNQRAINGRYDELRLRLDDHTERLTRIETLVDIPRNYTTDIGGYR